jgi:hypothetical protein
LYFFFYVFAPLVQPKARSIDMFIVASIFNIILIKFLKFLVWFTKVFFSMFISLEEEDKDKKGEQKEKPKKKKKGIKKKKIGWGYSLIYLLNYFNEKFIKYLFYSYPYILIIWIWVVNRDF